jgi:hypothetical protein
VGAASGFTPQSEGRDPEQRRLQLLHNSSCAAALPWLPKLLAPRSPSSSIGRERCCASRHRDR